MKRALSVITVLCLLLIFFAPAAVYAAEPVGYLPGVTKEMSDPAFWTADIDDPDAVLAAQEEIAQINAAALVTSGSNMHDLRSLPEMFDGMARNDSLQKGAAADAAYYLGWTYDETGKKLEQEDFDAIIANCADPNAAAFMTMRYGVAADRTTLLTFPYDGQILDDPIDYDFDYQALVGIRMNEPVTIFTTSADGKFYQVFTSCCSGWVRVTDIAVCRDKEEWLSAWDLPAEKRLVFYGDKMYTDYSKTSPETSRRLITMATVLERMDEQEDGALVVNRLPLHNYAVYLPVRNEDGSYSKKPALLNAREKISEDYLPLTAANLAKVALASLGDAYGWGGSLLNEDCSSLDRSIFCCFGLDLPRNGNLQWPLSITKVDTTYMTTEEKLALLDRMPLGTLLNFPGHQMFYLGKKNGKYYVVSAVSSIMSPSTGKRQRTRDVQINALDIKRANGQTWIQAVNHIYVPWAYQEQGEENDPISTTPYHAGITYILEKELIDSFEGGYFRPGETVTRAVLVDALWRAAVIPEPASDIKNFEDVQDGAAYEKAVLWAKGMNIIKGINGSFLPEGASTREQLAAMLYRCAAASGIDISARAELSSFRDMDKISDWALDAVQWAVSAGLLRGNTDGTLDPKRSASRAEAALLLQRMADLVKAEIATEP